MEVACHLSTVTSRLSSVCSHQSTLSRRFHVIGLPLLLAWLGSCDAPAQSTVAPPPLSASGGRAELVAEPLPSPTTGTSRAPQLASGGGRVILSWLEFANFQSSLWFAERTPEGWSAPQVVAQGDDFIDNAADVPSVLPLGDDRLVAQWLHGDYGNPEAYDLALTWSDGGGRTWSPLTHPHSDGTEAQHGFASLFSVPTAGVGVVWLDGRDFSEQGSTAGAMGLWAATYDGDGQQASERAIDTRVCDCCQTSAATTPAGVIVAYRDRSEDEVRDIRVVHLIDGQWSMPSLVHADNWTIHGCPVNGPAVSARGARVAVAWFTAATDEGVTLLARSADGGRTFDAPVRVDDGASRGLVDVELLPDESAAVSWVEFTSTRSEFRARRVERDGRRSPSMSIAAVVGGHYPRLAQGHDELLFAWVEADQGYTHLRTARVSLSDFTSLGATASRSDD